MGNLRDPARVLCLILAFLFVVPSGAGALTELSLTQPTGWWWLSNVTPEQLSERINLGFRIFDLEIESTSPLRLSAVLVHNAGPHYKTWWWYYNVTGDEVMQFLDLHGARLVDLEVYRINGLKRYAVAMVENAGADAKTWWYYSDVTFGRLRELIQQNQARLVDLDTYILDGERRFAAVMIANQGDDQKAWWWYTNLSGEAVGAKLALHDARLIDIEDREDGHFAVVMERSPGPWWWYYGITFEQLKELIAQNGARLIDLERYTVSGQTRFAVAMLDNSNLETRRLRGLVGSKTDGAFGFRVLDSEGRAITSLQHDRGFYPASTIKVLQHYHAMLEVQARRADLDFSTLDVYRIPSESCADDHAGHTVSLVSLRTALREMMEASDNQSTNAVQEFFGDGDAETGRSAINASAWQAGLSTETVLHHKFECGGPTNDPANQMTLTDITKFYRRLGREELFEPGIRTQFLDLMLTEKDVTLRGWIEPVVNEEAPQGVDVGDFVAGVRLAYKAGNFDITMPPPEQHYLSIAGWVQLPSADGPRSYAFGFFVDDAETLELGLFETAAELLRTPIRDALATWVK